MTEQEQKPLFHKIWNGASEELCQKIPDGKVDCIITDPPFGVDNQSNMAQTEVGKKYARKIANDESPEIAVATFKRVMDVLLPKTTDHCDLYVFTSYQVLSDWLVMTDEYLPTHGFHRKSVLVWEKDGPGMGDLEVPWGMGSEFILYFQKGRREKSAKRRNSVIHVPQLRPAQLAHPHEKPLPLLEMLIKASTVERDFIVDPFGGSGSLVRAARNTNRSALAIEYDQMNYEMALERMESQAGGLF